MSIDHYPIIHLAPVGVSANQIKEKIICIRAHRERIFRVAIEQSADKLIVHNYGQAGAGWTFLFGCVNQAMRLFEQQVLLDSARARQPIVVIGAGCYGLLTAILLARKGYQVSIVADEIDKLPSDKAAGFFFPRPRRTSTAEEIAIFEKTGMESYREYLSIIAGQHPFITHGPRLLPAYYGLDIDPGFAPYCAQGLVVPPRPVIIDFNNGIRHMVMEYQLVYINPSQIMQQLQAEVVRMGIPISRIKVDSFEQIDQPTIFNCAGLGAKLLASDKTIIPVQGHLITLCNQPNKEQLQYMINVRVPGFTERGIPRNDLIYYAPKDEGIIGITFLRGTDSLTSNQHEFERLIDRCQRFFGP